MRYTTSLLHIDNEFVKVIAAYDGLGQTENETSKDNRTIKYRIACKACNNHTIVHKRLLTKGATCTVCGARWQPLVGLPTYERQGPAAEAPITLLVNGTNITWFQGSLGTALEMLNKESLEDWIANGGLYHTFDIANARTGTLEEPRTIPNIMRQTLTQITPAPNTTHQELVKARLKKLRDDEKSEEAALRVLQAFHPAKPIPTLASLNKTVPRAAGMTAKELETIFKECKRHGQGKEAPNPIFDNPTGGRWALVPLWVYDEFQAQAKALSVTDFASWGILKHKVTIEKGAKTSPALASPPWVYAYETVLDTVPEFNF